MTCKVDSQPNHWFECANGTVGCPRIHDDRVPHRIAWPPAVPLPEPSDVPHVYRWNGTFCWRAA